MASMGDIIFASMIIVIIIFSTIIILFLTLGLAAGNGQSSSPLVAQSDNKWPVGNLGQDLLLSCYLPSRPPGDVSVTWSKAGLSGPVYCFRHGTAILKEQDNAFQDRTQVFPDAVVRGNVSLLLRRMRISDHGVYSCHVETSGSGGISSSLDVELRVGAFSAPSFAYSSGVLTATAPRWLPKPAVTWLDRGGTVLSGANTTFSSNAVGIYGLVSSLRPASPNLTYMFSMQSSVVLVVGEATITHDGEVSGRSFITYGCASHLATSKQMTVMSTCLLLSIMSSI